MRKFISDILFFAVFAAGFYLALLMLWGAYVPARFKPNLSYIRGAYGHSYSRFAEAKSFGKVDVLILGSSHAYRGIDTRIFTEHGYRAFNLGSSSQTPIQTQMLLERYLELFNPKTVIYEVYPKTFALDGVESALDLVSNDKNDWNSLKMALSIHNIKVYNTLIYATVYDLLGLNSGFKEKNTKGTDTYVSGGYVEKELSFFQPVTFEAKEITFKNNQLQAFTEFVTLLKQKDIPLLLVFAPIPKVNYNSYTNMSFFDAQMNKFGGYINFNEVISLNDSLHFYDGHHLNQHGVEHFNILLLEHLNYQ